MGSLTQQKRRNQIKATISEGRKTSLDDKEVYRVAYEIFIEYLHDPEVLNEINDRLEERINDLYQENEITADRDDMIAYMSEANSKGKWQRPTIAPDIPSQVATAIQNYCIDSRSDPAYVLHLEDSQIIAKHIDGTNHALHYRIRPHDDRIRHLPYWGEACLDVRYWLLQAEINDAELTVRHITDDVIESILSSSPPEWKDQIISLIDKYHQNAR